LTTTPNNVTPQDWYTVWVFTASKHSDAVELEYEQKHVRGRQALGEFLQECRRNDCTNQPNEYVVVKGKVEEYKVEPVATWNVKEVG
jgi:hypothetical protein